MLIVNIGMNNDKNLNSVKLLHFDPHINNVCYNIHIPGGNK